MRANIYVNTLEFLETHRQFLVPLLIEKGYSMTIFADIETRIFNTAPVADYKNVKTINIKRRSFLLNIISDFHLFLLCVFEQFKHPANLHIFISLRNCLFGLLALACSRRTDSVILVVTGIGSVKGVIGKIVFVVMRALIFWLIKDGVRLLCITQNDDDTKMAKIALGIPTEMVTQTFGSGVNLALYNSKRRQPKSNLTFAYIGRFIEAKGILDYVKLASTFTGKANFRAVGTIDHGNMSGLSLAKLDQMFKESGIAYNGASSNVWKELEDIDVLIFPSIYGEGLPKVILEAIAARVLVVAYKGTGITSLLSNDQDALLCEATDLMCMQSKIAKLIENPETVSEMTNNFDKLFPKIDIKCIERVYLSFINVGYSSDI